MSASNSVTQKLAKTRRKLFPGSKSPLYIPIYHEDPIDPRVYLQTCAERTCNSTPIVAIVEGKLYLEARKETEPEWQEVHEELYGREPK